MEVLVIWILFGVVAAVVATNKGWSGCGWFARGALLGPFGFILSLVVPKNQPEIEREAIDSGGMKKCPYCAELKKLRQSNAATAVPTSRSNISRRLVQQVHR